MEVPLLPEAEPPLVFRCFKQILNGTSIVPDCRVRKPARPQLRAKDIETSKRRASRRLKLPPTTESKQKKQVDDAQGSIIVIHVRQNCLRRCSVKEIRHASFYSRQVNANIIVTYHPLRKTLDSLFNLSLVQVTAKCYRRNQNNFNKNQILFSLGVRHFCLQLITSCVEFTCAVKKKW